MKGAAATGHPLTTQAALDMLAKGGNAFDAAIAAGFASVVTEPTLTSFGGGGFFLSHSAKEKKDILFDFFVNTPGIGLTESVNPEMTATPIQFPGCTQIFHTGYGSIAVPGVLKGLLHVHAKLCTLPLKEIMLPALSCLEEGMEINARQEIFLNLLKPIMTSSEYGRKMFMRGERYVKLGDRLHNPDLKEFCHQLAEGRNDIYSGEISTVLARAMKNNGGMVTKDDLDAYCVIEREPLRIHYRDRVILTNPPPSTGGVLLALGLSLLGEIKLSEFPRESEVFNVSLIEAMKEITTFSPERRGKLILYPTVDKKQSPSVQEFLKNITKRVPLSTRGTTHISVIDNEGNAASMTTSNGSGSGCYIPGTGIMLNNMMGEDDLHPGGFHSAPPNKRVSSMMIPTLVMKKGKVDCALGSGGSKRIRTAVLQALINIIDYKMSIEKAIESYRVHYEDGTVHIEPGMNDTLLQQLRKHYEINAWSSKDMYFGGVHCAGGTMDGWGDSRRGGNFGTV
jgi:gamma-glutamyltranspeptidase/glutathione hydrolase